MSVFRIHPSRIQAVLANMQAVDTQIRSMLTRLEQDATKNMADWQSQAKDAYTSCKQSWDASASQMPVQLANARNSLNEILANYNAMEQQGMNMWSGNGVGKR
ncbi:MULTISPECIES: WXG100 family type VII secretion target [unclassified Crossiella]|uniref:WXG100 family type VII secretion target n=1 Tax=Crossiella sp. CA-258035 TaxID=2981138 RepID=UPI0024BD363D|nr:WXG100 family type VII secretion target [Crossiella sp. CA-258035]WHT16857.1 WXG100 family type VII secretion target [Crossiella sp. CA-258035]